MANWVAGLAAFRSDDCTRAAGHFARVATAAHSKDLAAAGEFWAARADTACGRPDRVTARLRAAARYDDAFYGLLARRSEEHTSELQSLMRISYAVFCLKKKTHNNTHKV